MTAHSLRARFKETVSGAILDAAEELAAEEGIAKASLQAIAQRAGVAVGTIYNHFADRSELFDALFARRREELLTTLDHALKVSPSPTFDVQLDVFVRTVFSYFDTRRSFLRLALDAASPKAQADVSSKGSMEQLKLRADRIVRLGIKEKRLRADGADLMGHFLTAAIRAVLVARAEAAKPIAADTERVLALFLHGAER